MNKTTLRKIARNLDALIKVRKDLQTICDELDEAYSKSDEIRILRPLNAVQSAIDFIKEAEKELYTT